MEDIDFTNYEYAYDRVLELANCLNEKQNLIGKLFYEIDFMNQNLIN